MGLVAMRADGQSGLGHLAAKRTWTSTLQLHHSVDCTYKLGLRKTRCQLHCFNQMSEFK